MMITAARSNVRKATQFDHLFNHCQRQWLSRRRGGNVSAIAWLDANGIFGDDFCQFVDTWILHTMSLKTYSTRTDYNIFSKPNTSAEASGHIIFCALIVRHREQLRAQPLLD